MNLKVYVYTLSSWFWSKLQLSGFYTSNRFLSTFEA
jgi:hypothetical protein